MDRAWQSRARHGMPAEAAEAAREWAALVPGKPNELYGAASLLSRCVPVAKAAERNRYADTAIEMHRAAMAAISPDAVHGVGDPGLIPLILGAHDSIVHLYRVTGRYAEGLESYRKALQINDQRAREQPQNARNLCDLAASHTSIGNLLDETGRKAEALQSFERASAVYTTLLGTELGKIQSDEAFIAVHDAMVNLSSRLGRREAALESSQKSLVIRERRTQAHPENLGFQNDLAWCYHSTGDLLDQVGRKAEAIQSFEKSLAAYEKVVGKEAGKSQSDESLIGLHDVMGTLSYRMGRLAAALEFAQKALIIRERRAQSNPENLIHQADLAASYANAGQLLVQSGRRREAVEPIRKAPLIRERLALKHPESAEAASVLGLTLHSLGNLDESQGWADASKTCRQGIMHQKTAVKLDPGNAAYAGHLKNQWIVLGNLALRHGVPAEAVEAGREWAALVSGKPRELYDAASFLSRCVPLAKNPADAIGTPMWRFRHFGPR